jgi:hypothetical protein
MTPQARAIIDEIASLRGVNPDKITNPCRMHKVFRARIEVAKRLSQIGYSTLRIGAILNHDHSTILFYLGNGKKRPSRPAWRKPKVRTLRDYPRPKPPPRQSRLYLTPYAGADMREYVWTRRRITTDIRRDSHE